MPGLGEIKARLTLDTAQFIGPLTKAETQATASGRAIQRAAKQTADAQALAAKLAGETVTEQTRKILDASTKQVAASAELRKVQSYVRQGFLDEAVGADAAAAALQRKILATQRLAAANKIEAETAHASVTQTQAASAAIRSFEGNPGIRAVEKFVTTIPGVGQALLNIFPLIGAAAFASVVAKSVEEVYELRKAALAAAEATRNAFEDAHLKAQLRVDDLNIENDKIQQQIDKLQKRPGDGLQLALDEAKKRADLLQEALKGANKEIQEIFKQNSVSLFGSVLSGVASTKGQEEQIGADGKRLQSAARKADEEYLAAIGKDRSPEAIKAAGERRAAAIRAAYEPQIRAYDTEAKRLRDEQQRSNDLADTAERLGGAGVGTISRIDNSKKIANVEGVAGVLRDQLAEQSAGDRQEVLQTQLGHEKQAAAGGSGSDKAAEQRLKAYEAELNQQRLLRERSTKEEYDFWEARKSAFLTGSEQYNQIVAKQVTLAEQGAQKAHEAIRKFLGRPGEDAAESQRIARQIDEQEEVFRKAAEKRNQAQRELQDQGTRADIDQAQNSAREQEAKLTDEAGRSISRLGAAYKEAQVHAAEYLRVLHDLEALQRGAATDLSSEPGNEEAQRKLAAANKAIEDLGSKRKVQLQSDSDAVNGRGETSPLVGATDAIDAFVRSTEDAAATMRQLTDSTLASFNKTLTDILTNPRVRAGREFKELGRGVATKVTEAGLEGAEGKVLGALGFGKSRKPTGAKGDPLSVYVENAGGQAGSSAAALASLFGQRSSSTSSNAGGGGFLSSIFGGDDDSDSSRSGSGVASALLAGLPAFASGGAIDAGTMAIIGEKGPELFMPKTSGTIVPNHMLGGAAGGDTHYHVDARGATDPAQVKAQVMEGIRQAAPHLVAASVRATGEKRMRQPSSVR